MKEYLRKIANVIVKIEKTVILIALPAMCITILVNTIARFTGLFIDRLIWAEEFARYLMIGMAFIGAALVMQEDGHYKMTAVVDAVKGKPQLIIKGVSSVITIVFMIILAKVGLDCCLKIARMGQTSPVLKIPMWIPYASIPVGMFLGIIQTIILEIIGLMEMREAKRGEQV